MKTPFRRTDREQELVQQNRALRASLGEFKAVIEERGMLLDTQRRLIADQRAIIQRQKGENEALLARALGAERLADALREKVLQ